jgi:hypothetical protein
VFSIVLNGAGSTQRCRSKTTSDLIGNLIQSGIFLVLLLSKQTVSERAAAFAGLRRPYQAGEQPVDDRATQMSATAKRRTKADSSHLLLATHFWCACTCQNCCSVSSDERCGPESHDSAGDGQPVRSVPSTRPAGHPCQRCRLRKWFRAKSTLLPDQQSRPDCRFREPVARNARRSGRTHPVTRCRTECSELANRLDSKTFKSLLTGDLSNAPDPANRHGARTLWTAWGLDDCKAIRFVHIAGQLGQKLVRGDADGGNQIQFIPDVCLDGSSRLFRRIRIAAHSQSHPETLHPVITVPPQGV